MVAVDELVTPRSLDETLHQDPSVVFAAEHLWECASTVCICVNICMSIICSVTVLIWIHIVSHISCTTMEWHHTHLSLPLCLSVLSKNRASFT